MNENILEGCETKQDSFIKALDYAFAEKMDCAEFILRNQFDKSEISESDIKPLLFGKYRLIWKKGEYASIIDIPNVFQERRMNLLKRKYDELICYKEKYYKVLEEKNLEMFLEMTNVKVKPDVVYSSDSLKKLVFSLKGDFFIIKDDKVLYLEKTENPKIDFY